MKTRLFEYRHKLRILRQIMSNKAEFHGRLNLGIDVATVFVSSGLTFVGFSGQEK